LGCHVRGVRASHAPLAAALGSGHLALWLAKASAWRIHCSCCGLRGEAARRQERGRRLEAT